MAIMFRAIDDNYKMPIEFKRTLTILQNFDQLRNKRIRKNLIYFIDWMEKFLPKKRFYEISGKSYCLDDSILYRIQKTEIPKKSNKYEEPMKFEGWLMSHIFRYVKNPAKENNLFQKYIGKVKFTKIVQSKFKNDVYEKWIPPKKNESGEDVEQRADVDNIEIVVYSDNAMEIERKYEVEHGWMKEWENFKWRKEWDRYGWFLRHSPVPDKADVVRYQLYKEFKCLDPFVQKWTELKTKMNVPGWYHFDPKCPDIRPLGHNKMKEWDPYMFNFLKEKKWMERKNNNDEQGRILYEEKSSFVINCEDFLGIGGQSIVIRKPLLEKNRSTPEEHYDRKYEALKIIPIMKHHFEDENLVKEMESRVNARHAQADPEHIFHGAGQRSIIDQPMDINESISTKKVNLAETYLNALEGIQIADQDVEISENHGVEFRHDSLMEFSNIQLDFIQMFGERILVLVIG